MRSGSVLVILAVLLSCTMIINSRTTETDLQHHARHHRKLQRWIRSHRHRQESRVPIPSLALPETAFTIEPSSKKHEDQEGIDNLVPSVNNKGLQVSKVSNTKVSSTNTISSNTKLSSNGGIFSSPNCTTVMAQTGTTAILHCEVNDIAENTVTWIRKKNHILLTVGLVTYSADHRFFTAHGRHPRDWALHIRFAAPGDAGMYECQVPTHPPTSLYVNLVVVEANAEILGGPDKMVHEGSMLKLVCQIRKSTEPPTFLFWYHENTMVNYDYEGIYVSHTSKSSELVIRHAEPRHAGNYTCAPSNAKPDSITVHILHSETPAAMQHGNQSATSRAYQSSICICLLIYVLNVVNSVFGAYCRILM